MKITDGIAYIRDQIVAKATADSGVHEVSETASFASALDRFSGSHQKDQQGHKVYLKTDDMLYSGGNGTGLSYYIKYDEHSTEEDPIVVAKGVDEWGQPFEQTIHINDINPRSATIVEMRALEAHLGVERVNGLSSLPMGIGNMTLHQRGDFVQMLEREIIDLRRLGYRKAANLYQNSMHAYQGI